MSATQVEPARHIRPVGPVDILVVGFPDAKPDGTIAETVGELVAQGTIRILDALVVYKDDGGEVTLVEITDLDGDGIPDLVAIRGDVPGLLTGADARAVVDALPDGSAVMLLAWENTWAIRASMALRGSGGVLLGYHRVPDWEIEAAMDEFEAMIDEDPEI